MVLVLRHSSVAQNMFAVHGDLAHVKVVYDRSTGKSMGYGFVKFTTNEAAAAATAAINGMAIDRKRIKASRVPVVLRLEISYSQQFLYSVVREKYIERKRAFFYCRHTATDPKNVVSCYK